MLYSFLNNKQEYPLEETFTRLDMPSGEGEKWRVYTLPVSFLMAEDAACASITIMVS
jgi:hypothetical protein